MRTRSALAGQARAHFWAPPDSGHPAHYHHWRLLFSQINRPRHRFAASASLVCSAGRYAAHQFTLASPSNSRQTWWCSTGLKAPPAHRAAQNACAPNVLIGDIGRLSGQPVVIGERRQTLWPRVRISTASLLPLITEAGSHELHSSRARPVGSLPHPFSSLHGRTKKQANNRYEAPECPHPHY